MLCLVVHKTWKLFCFVQFSGTQLSNMNQDEATIEFWSQKIINLVNSTKSFSSKLRKIGIFCFDLELFKFTLTVIHIVDNALMFKVAYQGTLPDDANPIHRKWNTCTFKTLIKEAKGVSLYFFHHEFMGQFILIK